MLLFLSKKKARLSKLDEEESSVLISCDDTRTATKKNSKTIDQSSATDESSFGSCEPGTNVVLQGIVWNETDKGNHPHVTDITDSPVSWQVYWWWTLHGEVKPTWVRCWIPPNRIGHHLGRLNDFVWLLISLFVSVIATIIVRVNLIGTPRSMRSLRLRQLFGERRRTNPTNVFYAMGNVEERTPPWRRAKWIPSKFLQNLDRLERRTHLPWMSKKKRKTTRMTMIATPWPKRSFRQRPTAMLKMKDVQVEVSVLRQVHDRRIPLLRLSLHRQQ